ncbi:FIST N-terminal domain-containing protein [soil metagenome]
MIKAMIVDRPLAKLGAPVRTAATRVEDPDLAAQVLFAELDPTTLAGVMLFCSSRYDLDRLAKAINRRSEGLCVVGCTSSGEITPGGTDEGTITAIGFPASDFTLTATRFDHLDAFDASRAQGVVRGLRSDAIETSSRLGASVSRAAIFLVDGLSHREEMLTVTVQDALGDIPLIGGSSGDGLDFKETFIFQDGAFRRDAALVAVLSSARPLKVFRSQHYIPGKVKMVITGADPVGRVVTEINAEPAAQEYARLAGTTVERLGPSVYSSHPPMVRAGGEYYVRSIQSANPDGSLTFYCAIDEGVVLTLGEPRDILDGLKGVFDGLRQAVGEIDQIIGFDCVLNRIEAEQRQLTRKVSKMFVDNHVTGFNTYGEQYNALHVNQTFCGLAIGWGR